MSEIDNILEDFAKAGEYYPQAPIEYTQAKAQLLKAIMELDIFKGCYGCSCDSLEAIKELFGEV